MAELADASDSKSGVHYGRIGSTPITAIFYKRSIKLDRFFLLRYVINLAFKIAHSLSNLYNAKYGGI